MSLLSCSSRQLSPPVGTPHHGCPTLALSPSSSSASGKSSFRVTWTRIHAGRRECDSGCVSSDSSAARGRSQSFLARFHPFRILGGLRTNDEQWHKVRGGGGESEFASAAVEEFDGEGRRVLRPGRWTLLYSCAGVPLTLPGVVSASLPPSHPMAVVTMHDFVACLITVAGALSLLKFFDELAKRDALEKKLSRKLVHIVVGLGYMLFWPLFSTSSVAKYLCALAPGGNAIRMLGLGFGLLENEAMVKAMSREGDRRELLKGPFYYALAIVVVTVCFWRTSPVGIVALVNLCAGDGFADIIGRSFGGEFRLPWNEEKSWAGSVAFFVASTLTSILYLLYFANFGFLQMPLGLYSRVALVSFLTAIVESLPISTRLDDNLTVPFSAMLLGFLILPS